MTQQQLLPIDMAARKANLNSIEERDYLGLCITMAGLKGGIGKSTTTFHIGTELMSRGFKVGFLDIDTKLNTYYLCQRREEVKYWLDNGQLPESPQFYNDDYLSIMNNKIKSTLKEKGLVMPEYEAAPKVTALKDIVKAMRTRVDFLLIDTGGGDSDNGRRAITYSNMVVLPFLPSIMDIDTMPETLDVIEEIKATENPVIIKGLVNEKPTHSGDFRAKQLRLVIKQFPLLSNSFKTQLDHIYAYRDSLSFGLGVSEWNNSKAKGQVSYLVEEILKDLVDG
jgi:chromosome partitioning protein